MPAREGAVFERVVSASKPANFTFKALLSLVGNAYTWFDLAIPY